MNLTSESLAARDVSAHSARQASLPQEKKVHGSSLEGDQTLAFAHKLSSEDQLHRSKSA